MQCSPECRLGNSRLVNLLNIVKEKPIRRIGLASATLNRNEAFYLLFLACLFIIAFALLVTGAWVALTLHPNIQTITNPYVAILWPVGLTTLFAGIAVFAGAALEWHLRRIGNNVKQSSREIRELKRTVDSLSILSIQQLQAFASAQSTGVQIPQPSTQPTQPQIPQQPLLIPYLALTGLLDNTASSIEQLITLLQTKIERKQSIYLTRAVQILAGLEAVIVIVLEGATFFSSSPTTILQLIVAMALVALVMLIILVSLDFSTRTRFISIQDALAGITFAMKVPIYGFRSRIAETGTLTQQSITETHEFFILLDTAIRYRFLQLASDILDDATKKIFKAEVDYIADPNTTYWSVLATSLGKGLLNSNDTIKDLVGRLQAYSVELAANQRVS